MPFAMTHLIIADRLYGIFGQHIDDQPQFMLGSVAPDAVHNRAEYVSDFKKASHLCVGDEKWGYLTNTGEWTANVVRFAREHIGSGDKDFILGYCAHILSDIYNNMTEWIPFKARFPDEAAKGYGNAHHQDSNRIDIELSLTHGDRDRFRQDLSLSKGVDLPGVIYSSEIEKQKDNILNVWYAGKERPDLSANRIVTYESMMKFIDGAVGFIEPVYRTNILKNEY